MSATAPNRGVRRSDHHDRIQDIGPTSVAPDYPGRTVMRAGRGREEQRRVDAYQAEVIDLAELKARRERIRGRRQVLTAQGDQEQRLQAERQAAKAVWSDLEAFCRRIRSRLDEATLAERQRVLRLLIERVIVGEDSLEIRHVIPMAARAGSRHAAPRRSPRGRVTLGGSDPRGLQAVNRVVDCVRMVCDQQTCRFGARA